MPPKLAFWGFDPLNGEAYQQKPQKAHLLAERRHYDVQIVKIGPQVRPMRVTKEPKKKDKERNQMYGGKLRIR